MVKAGGRHVLSGEGRGSSCIFKISNGCFHSMPVSTIVLYNAHGSFH